MSMREEGLVKCPACGRKFRFRSELAGKKVKCGCESVLRFPDQAGGEAEMIRPAEGSIFSPKNEASASPSGPPSPKKKAANELSGYDLHDSQHGLEASACPKCAKPIKPGAVICVNCGFHLKEGKQIQSDVGQPTAAGKPKGKPGKATPQVDGLTAALSKKSNAGKKALEEAEAKNQRDFIVKDLAAPIIMAVVGVACLFIRTAFLAEGDAVVTLVAASIEVAARLILQIPFVVIAVFLTARIMQTSFGPLPAALLKVTALTYFTVGIGGLVHHVLAEQLGFLVMFIDWPVQLGLFWGCCAFLFALDFMETSVLWVLSILIPGLVLVTAFTYIAAMISP